jgi:hypothetical protein
MRLAGKPAHERILKRGFHSMFRFDVFWGMCDVNSRNVFLLLIMALWVPISATLFRRAVLMMWHAFLFLGLRFFPLFFFLLGGLNCSVL